MSGDWIKMRSDLFTHPKVVRISSALKADTLRTVGGLMSAWCLFDAHSVDGVLEGYTSQALDDHLRWPGFAREMVMVSWLVDCGESLELPRFDTHNGQSAKRRAQDSERKRNDRKTSASDADKSRTREEKRREEINTLSVSTDTMDGKAVDQAKPRIPESEILAAYHEHLPMLTAVRKMTDNRKRKLKARWCEDAERQSPEYWQKFFAYVAQSDFLTGRDNRWTACDFEWLIEPSNHVKVIEGKYENRGQA